MCRNIKKLRVEGREPSDEEILLAATQFIRKVSGYNKPSRRNQPAFDQAVVEVAAAVRELFRRLPSGASEV